MSRRPATFRQSEITRIAKGLHQAGVDVTRVEVEPNGKIVMMTATLQSTDAAAKNEWDGAE